MSPSGLSRTSSSCKRQTRPLVREGVSHQQTYNCLTVITIWPWATDGCLIPRDTGRLTIGRNITLALMLTSSQSRVVEIELESWVKCETTARRYRRERKGTLLGAVT
jgi:hypothetical protein